MSQRNKVLLLGAMSIANPLPEIAQELRAIRALFKGNAAFGYECEYEPSLDVPTLQDVLRANNDQTLIIHFAGHSSSEVLQTDVETVYAHHVANLIGTWKHPPDVLFLNGCNSAGQVKSFLKAGIACVIATQNYVNDGVARQFALNVYKHLLDDEGTVGLQTAFERAQHDTSLVNRGQPRSLDISDLDHPPQEWDWGLFAESENILQTWTLSRPVIDNQAYSPNDRLAKFATTGEDEYGHYADLRINGAIQRLRWIALDEAGFWLADTECTQALWQATMDNNPAEFKLSPEHPVERVSWSQVQQFLRKLNTLLPGVEARLPTEQEWDVACRAGTTTTYAFGNEVTQEQVNFAGKSTMAVKSLPPNTWGLYTMHGNVWEWCHDGDDRKVICGGSWALSAEGVRSDTRGFSAAGNRDSTIGFRFAVKL